MKHWIRTLFITAALYDGATGILFLTFGATIYAYLGMELPNHLSYLQYPALLLLVFAAMFLRIGADPLVNRALMPYGIAMKAAFPAVVFYHQATDGIPFLWVTWAWVDVVFLVLFVAAWQSIRRRTAQTAKE